jgi:hypothetical protein
MRGGKVITFPCLLAFLPSFLPSFFLSLLWAGKGDDHFYLKARRGVKYKATISLRHKHFYVEDGARNRRSQISIGIIDEGSGGNLCGTGTS